MKYRKSGRRVCASLLALALMLSAGLSFYTKATDDTLAVGYSIGESTYTLTAHVFLDSLPYAGAPLTVRLLRPDPTASGFLTVAEEPVNSSGQAIFTNLPYMNDCFFFIQPGEDDDFAVYCGELLDTSIDTGAYIWLDAGYTVSATVTLDGVPMSGIEVGIESIIEIMPGYEKTVARFYSGVTDANGLVTIDYVPINPHTFLYVHNYQQVQGNFASYLGYDDPFVVTGDTHREIKLEHGYSFGATLTAQGAPITDRNYLLYHVIERERKTVYYPAAERTPNHTGTVEFDHIIPGDYCLVLLSLPGETLPAVGNSALFAPPSGQHVIYFSPTFTTTRSYGVASFEIATNFDDELTEPESKIIGVKKRTLLGPGRMPTQNIVVEPGSKIRLPLYADDFEWSGAPGNLTTAKIKACGFGVGKTILAGDSVIESIRLEDTAQSVELVVEFAQTDQTAFFNLQTYITQGSAKTALSSDIISGTIQASGSSYSSGGGGSGSSKGNYQRIGLPDSSAAFSPNASSISSDTSDTAIATDWALKELQSALTALDPEGRAVIKATNASAVSLELMRKLVASAGTVPVLLQADTLGNDGNVNVRVFISPAMATKDIQLTASTVSEQARRLQAIFERHFNNQLTVVSFAQPDTFGMLVEVAAKLNSGMNENNLVFYSYDSSTNCYNLITPAPVYIVDANGYVRFLTSVAGDILIVDGALTAK